MDDLPKRLGKPAERALAAAGISRLSQCAKLSEAEVGKLHGVGPKAVAVLRSTLTAQGLSFAGEGAQNAPSADESNNAEGERVYDSPVAWINSHIQEYVESNGAKGHRWRGVQTLLLTTSATLEVDGGYLSSV
jgi:hypothetical protein